MPSTRSKNPPLEALPPKFRDRTNRKTRAPQEPINDEEPPQTTDQGNAEAATRSRGKRVEAPVARNKRAPASTTPVTTVSRAVLGRTAVRASMGEALGTPTSKGMKNGNGVTTVAGRSSGLAVGETQGVNAVTQLFRSNGSSEEGEEVEDEEPRISVNMPKTPSTQKGKGKAISQDKRVPKGSNKSSRSGASGFSAAHPASTPGRAPSNENEMNELLSNAVKPPGTQDLTLQQEEEGEAVLGNDDGDDDEDYVPDSILHSHSGRRLSDWDLGKQLAITAEMKKDRRSSLDYSDKEHEASETSLLEDDEVDDLTLFVFRMKEYSDMLSSIRDKMRDLMSDFTALKSIQNSGSIKETGYMKLLSTITYNIINNRSRRLSLDEKFTLEQLDEAMTTLSRFYVETKDFEAIFKRFGKYNFTQRSNIEKCQAGIQKTMDSRGFTRASWLIPDDSPEAVQREKNKKAAHKRNQEIRAVLRKRERAFRYQTPESFEGRSQKRRRREEEYEEAEEESQGQFHMRQDGRGQKRRRREEGEGEKRLQEPVRSRQNNRGQKRREGVEGAEIERLQEQARVSQDEEYEYRDLPDEEGWQGEGEGGQGEEGEGGEEGEREEEEEEEREGEREEEEGEEREEEGEENLPIVIDEDYVEIVHVEGFGERQKKAREREERERDEGEVEVLEDHDWEELEIRALLEGIEIFQGKHRFSRIKDRYGHGNRAPLENRSVEAIRDKAIELKNELIESGSEGIMGDLWDGI